MTDVILENPGSVPAPFAARFSNVARINVGTGALLLMSGQVGVDDSGEVLAPGDVRVQTRRIYELIGGLLGAYGATFADVAHVRTFLTNMDDLAAYADVRREYFDDPRPASTTVEVSRLFAPGVVVEVEVTAFVSKA